MKPIGILCASDAELAPFFYFQKEAQIKKAMVTYHIGRIDNVSCILAYTGVCKVNAAIAAQAMIDAFAPCLILNAGTAGGMGKHVSLMDTIVSERAAYHDVDQEILTDYHPWLTASYFYGDKEALHSMREIADTQKLPILFGDMVTGEQFIEQDLREGIIKQFAPLSVDMETTAIAHVCYANGIGFLSIRTITDTEETSGHAAFEAHCEQASKQSAFLTVTLLKQLSLKTSN